MMQPNIARSNGATSGGATFDAATIERLLRLLARKAGGMTGADLRDRPERQEKGPAGEAGRHL